MTIFSFHCSRRHIPQVSHDIQCLGTMAHWYNSSHLCVSILDERKIGHNLKKMIPELANDNGANNCIHDVGIIPRFIGHANLLCSLTDIDFKLFRGSKPPWKLMFGVKLEFCIALLPCGSCSLENVLKGLKQNSLNGSIKRIQWISVLVITEC